MSNFLPRRPRASARILSQRVCPRRTATGRLSRPRAVRQLDLGGHGVAVCRPCSRPCTQAPAHGSTPGCAGRCRPRSARRGRPRLAACRERPSGFVLVQSPSRHTAVPAYSARPSDVGREAPAGRCGSAESEGISRHQCQLKMMSRRGLVVHQRRQGPARGSSLVSAQVDMKRAPGLGSASRSTRCCSSRPGRRSSMYGGTTPDLLPARLGRMLKYCGRCRLQRLPQQAVCGSPGSVAVPRPCSDTRCSGSLLSACTRSRSDRAARQACGAQELVHARGKLLTLRQSELVHFRGASCRSWSRKLAPTS